LTYLAAVASHLRTGEGIRRGGKQYEAMHTALAKGAALELADVGYGDFSPEAVAQRVGVSPRTAFRHYETKLALAIAGIESLPTYQGWLDTAQPGESFADRMRRGLRMGAEHLELVAFITATALSFRETQPELLKTLRKHVLARREKAMGAYLAEGQRAGVFRPEVTPAAMAAADLGIFTMAALGQFSLGRGETRVKRLFNTYWPLMATTEHIKD
jgi:AcrR family transcriptional regulator